MMALPPDSKRLSLPSGLKLHVEHTSPPSGVPSELTPVLFIHGLGGSGANIGPVIDASGLAGTRRIITLDLEGQGLSPLSGNEVTIANYAESVREVLDVLGVEKAIVMGHSIGGLIAATLASTYPKRVMKLILLGAVRQLEGEHGKGVLARADAVRKDGMIAVADAVATKGMSQRSLATLPIVRHFFRATILHNHVEGYALACEAVCKATDPDYSKIEADALIVSGEEDLGSPKEVVEFFMNHIPKARAIRLKDIGSLLIAEDVEGVARLIREFIEV